MIYQYKNTTEWINCLLSIQRNIQKEMQNIYDKCLVYVTPVGSVKDVVKISIAIPSTNITGVYECLYDDVLETINKSYDCNYIVDKIKNTIKQN